jgi:hypothetical protein
MFAGGRTRALARKRAGRSPGRYSPLSPQKSAKARSSGARRLARFFHGAAARARATGNGAMPRKAGRSKPAAGPRCRRRPLRPRAVKQRSRTQPRSNSRASEASERAHSHCYKAATLPQWTCAHAHHRDFCTIFARIQKFLPHRTRCASGGAAHSRSRPRH